MPLGRFWARQSWSTLSTLSLSNLPALRTFFTRLDLSYRYASLLASELQAGKHSSAAALHEFCTRIRRDRSTAALHATAERRMPLHLYDGTSAACTKKEMADNKDAFEAHVNKRICDHSCERRPCIRRVAAMAWRSITWRSAIRRRRDGPAPTQ